MSRYGNLGDVDTAQEIADGPIHLAATGASYEVYIRKYREYVDVGADEPVPGDKLGDYAVSNFLLALAKERQWKPHFKKAAQAAIRSMQLRAKVPLLFDRKDLFMESHLVLARWGAELKTTPYHQTSATPYSAQALGLIMGMLRNSHEDYRDVAAVVLTCFTSLRYEDLDLMTESMITITPASKTMPRRIVIILKQTKNDKSGTGSIIGRTFVLPCLCCQEMNKEEKKVWVKECKKTPKTVCPEPCPYQQVLDYQYIKRYDGTDSKGVPLVKGDLSFARRLTARGSLTTPRTLTCYKLGLQEMRKGAKRVNEMLPEHLRLEKPTGHAGRNTLCTIAVNEGGVDPTKVAFASKHRDPRTLKGYIKADETVLAAAAFGVGIACKAAVVDAAKEDSEEEEDEKSDGSAPAMSQKHSLPHHYQPAAKRGKAMSNDPNYMQGDGNEEVEEQENKNPDKKLGVAERLPAAAAAAAAVISSAGGVAGATYNFHFNF